MTCWCRSSAPCLPKHTIQHCFCRNYRAAECYAEGKLGCLHAHNQDACVQKQYRSPPARESDKRMPRMQDPDSLRAHYRKVLPEGWMGSLATCRNPFLQCEQSHRAPLLQHLQPPTSWMIFWAKSSMVGSQKTPCRETPSTCGGISTLARSGGLKWLEALILHGCKAIRDLSM